MRRLRAWFDRLLFRWGLVGDNRDDLERTPTIEETTAMQDAINRIACPPTWPRWKERTMAEKERRRTAGTFGDTDHTQDLDDECR